MNTDNRDLRVKLAELTKSSRFFIAFQAVGVVLGAAAAIVLRFHTHWALALAIIIVAVFLANQLAFGDFETHFIFGFLMLVFAFFAPVIPKFLFGIPGAVAGCLASMAILDFMDRPNQEAAAIEWQQQHAHELAASNKRFSRRARRS